MIVTEISNKSESFFYYFVVHNVQNSCNLKIKVIICAQHKNTKNIKFLGEYIMAVTETTSEGWFSRLGGAIKGVFAGIILIFVAIIMLGWNEKRSVDRYNTIDYAKNNFVETAADKIDSATEGKLVHFNGMTATNDVLTDKDFGVTVNNSLSLNRDVEMYQWKEIEHKSTKKNAGGSTTTTTTYTYEKGWASGLINSSSFHESGHDNPTVLPYKAEDTVAENVTLGAHKIPSHSASHLGSAEAVALEADKVTAPVSAIIKGNTILYNLYKEEKAQQAKKAFEANANVATTETTATEATATPEATTTPVANKAFSAIEFQASEAAPQIGDIRITFKKHPVCNATVVAEQKGEEIVAHKTPSGEFYEVRTGLMTAAEVFKAAEDENAMLTWILRIVGFLMIWGGFGAIFKPISVLADVIPLFGDIAESGISIISGLLAAVLSFGVIAIAWLFCRPLIGILLLILMGVAIFGIITLIAKVRAAKKAAAPAPAAEPAPETTPAA